MDKVFNIEIYLEQFFCTDERLLAARKEVLAFQEGSDLSSSFDNLEAAENWVRRVEAWTRNLRRDLEGDSLPAPGMSGARWLLFPSEHVTTNLSTGEIRCQLCRNCRAALSGAAGGNGKPRVEMPRWPEQTDSGADQTLKN